MIMNAQLIAEALEEIKPYDKASEMRRKINGLRGLAEESEGRMNKADLALVITGNPEGVEVMAKAYAKALKAYGLITGGGANGPPVGTVNWPRDVEDAGMSRSMLEYDWAYKIVREAEGRAEGGALIIRNLHDRPYVGWVDEDDAAPKAEAGGLRAIAQYLTEDAPKGSTPVLVLTGDKEKLPAFISQHPDLYRFFNNKILSVCTEAPPEPEVSTALDAAMTVRSPLKLKPRNPAFS